MSDRIETLSRRALLGLGVGLATEVATQGPAFAAPAAPSPIMLRSIPHSGEELPVVGLGTVDVFDIGDDPAERRERAAVLRTLVAGGGKVIDTAPSYGRAETALGDLLAQNGLRPRVFLATKLEPYDSGAGDAAMRASLKRLRTHRVDLMQFHNVSDPNQDLGMLRAWKAQGLCRYIGITTTFRGAFPAAEAVLRREKPDFLQINYSLDDRGAEARVIPAAAEVGAAVLTALPFGRKRLFGAVQGHQVPAWAKSFSADTWAQFFLKFLISNPAVTVVIPGTGNPAHMADDLGAGRGPMPDAAERRRMVQFISNLD